MQHVQQGPVQLLALNITQVAKTLGLSRAKVYALIATEVFSIIDNSPCSLLYYDYPLSQRVFASRSFSREMMPLEGVEEYGS